MRCKRAALHMDVNRRTSLKGSHRRITNRRNNIHPDLPKLPQMVRTHRRGYSIRAGAWIYKDEDMNASVEGALKQIDLCWRWFEHDGRKFSKDEVITILTAASKKGYKSTKQITTQDIIKALES